MPSPVVNRDCESLRVSGRFQPTTLEQTQRSQDECQDASKAIRVDLGNCTGFYLKEQRVTAQNNRGFFGKRNVSMTLRQLRNEFSVAG